MIAGIRDAHLHLAEHGEELSCVRLDDCRSREGCLERLAQAAASGRRATGGWIKAVGARAAAWTDPRWPTADEIDHAVAGVPAVVLSFDHHALVCGRGALLALGIDNHIPDPPGGIIERDRGRLTGLMLEAACMLVRERMPAPTLADIRAFVLAAQTDLRRHGIVEVHDMLARPALARVLHDLDLAGELELAVRLYATREHFEPMARSRAEWESGRVRLAGMKIFTDGTLNSRTAWMLHDFREPMPGHPRGTALMTPGEIEEAVRFADSLGYPIAAHAIGDAAVRAVLDALDRVRPRLPGQRIEHAQFIDEADIPRFGRLGVIAGMQPCHLLTDIEAIRRFTPHREERAFPLRDLIDAAKAAGREPPDLVWLGSDAPIVPPDPADNVQAAVLRRRVGMSESEMVGVRQRISEREVLVCMR